MSDREQMEDEEAPSLGPRSTRVAVSEYLRRRILRGSLAPGERVLQAELAEHLQISITPVREAIRELSAEGLLDTDPQRGVVVHALSRQELVDLYDVRLVVEPVGMASTVEKITPSELRRAESLVEEMERTESIGQWIELNARFHELLTEAAKRPRLASFLAQLRGLSTFYISHSLREREYEIAATHNPEHRRLLDACRRGDVEMALEVERQHLSHTLEMGLELLDRLSL
jgi:DNA-binding GntR family transcriptional regulator